MLLTLLMLAGGLVLLILGGELLVRGSVQVAEKLGVSPLIIGLTLVGFGTSTPELVTSVNASLIGAPGIAVGNIVGSNIANILLIVGTAALLLPLRVSARALWRDGGYMIAMSVMFLVVGYTVGLSRLSGVLFLAGLVGYMAYAYRQERLTLGAEPEGHTAGFDKAEALASVDPGVVRAPRSGLWGWMAPILAALAGLFLIIIGGKLLVDSAITLARVLGMSESVIGLTIVAVGTSLPELVTSVIAALRKQSDIAVGNVLGSNIYNILGIGGATGLIVPTAFPPDMLGIDLFVMLGSAIALFLFALDRSVSRLEGALLLAAYVGYTAWLLMR
ncbi:MAG: calcium/sodium antiporter [Sphingomonadaceae bacterium]